MKWRLPTFICIGGILLLFVGLRVYGYKTGEKVEFIETKELETESIRVDISGAVEKPGVYEMVTDQRVADALEIAGGLSEEADREWVAKRLNLAAKLTDGWKIYIPKSGEGDQENKENQGMVLAETISEDILNINTASKSELEDLPGIGPVTAEKIITNRPYQNIEELVTKKVLGAKTLEKIKEHVTVF